MTAPTKRATAAETKAAGKKTEKRIAAAVRTLCKRLDLNEFDTKQIEAKASGTLVVLPGVLLSPDAAEKLVALVDGK